MSFSHPFPSDSFQARLLTPHHSACVGVGVWGGGEGGGLDHLVLPVPSAFSEAWGPARLGNIVVRASGDKWMKQFLHFWCERVDILLAVVPRLFHLFCVSFILAQSGVLRNEALTVSGKNGGQRQECHPVARAWHYRSECHWGEWSRSVITG